MIIQVRVKPRARASELAQAADGTWTASVRAPPTDGRANEELIALVARQFRRPRSAVSIRSGATGRTKLVRIDPA